MIKNKKEFLSMLRDEIWKVFHTKAFYIALAVGLAIQLYNVIWNIGYVQEFCEYASTHGTHTGAEDRSLFTLWVSSFVANMAYFLFRYLFALLALIPYGWSFVNEANTGYRNQLLSRVSKTQYFTAKYIGTFVSGFAVIAIPLLVNLLLNAMICPAVVASSYSIAVPVSTRDIMFELYRSHPWVYVLIWVVLSGLWGGVMAGTAALLSQFINKVVIVLILPCVLVYLSTYLMRSSLVLGPWTLDDKFLMAHSWQRTFPMIFGEMGIIILLSFGGGLLINRHREPL